MDSNRIDGLAVPARMLAVVQIAMGFFALSSLPLYGYTFDVMRWLVSTLGRTDQGYFFFNLSRSAIAMAITLPAKTILASGPQNDPETLRFLVASGMVSSLMQGHPEESFHLWSTYRPLLFGTGTPDLF